jgi:hypothetical protein
MGGPVYHFQRLWVMKRIKCFTLTFLAIFALILLSACSILPIRPASTPLPNYVPPLGATGTPPPTPTPDPASFILLGPEVTVKDAGYAFQPIAAWNSSGEKLPFSQADNMASMGNKFTGLYLNLNSEKGGINHSSSDCLTMIRDRMAASMTGFQTDEPQALITNNVPGLSVGFKGQLNDLAVAGKLTTFFPNTRCFSLIAFNSGANAENLWETSGQYAYAKLLDSLRFLDQLQAASCQVSADPSYGLTPDNPIRVGNTNIADGLQREELYLNTLRGPGFEEVTFTRLNPLYNTAREIVDAYTVNYPGLAEPVTLYFEIFKFETPEAPLGFNCEAPFPLNAP